MYIYNERKNEWVPLRTTNQYRKKKKIVRDAWIVVATIMCTLPVSMVMVLALLATFLSFMLLDESIYSHSTHH